MSESFDLDASDGPLAVGRTAEVYAVGDSHVLKLLKPGFEVDLLEKEAARTEAVGRLGIRVPAVFGRVEVDGRTGVLFERIDGSSMLDVIFAQPARYEKHALQLAELHAEVLRTSGDGDLPTVKDALAERIDRSGLPVASRVAAKDALLLLPDGSSVLHGDFHPGNVLLTQEGPVTIDWADASLGAPAADVARSLLLLTPESAAEVLADHSEMHLLVTAFSAAYRRRCMGLLELTESEITAWRLPVLAARLGEGLEGETKSIQAEIASLVA